MRPPRLWLLLLLGAAAQNEDCSEPSNQRQLRTRPWFCEQDDGRGRTDSDDLAKCLGEGHTLNNTEPGLCRGRWQWYQLETLHDHVVPYYEIAMVNGSRRHVRSTRIERDVRHAVAFHLQTEFCPHTAECGTSGNPSEYYTTVDVLVVNGEMNHPWDTATPFGAPFPQSIKDHYPGDLYGRGYRYYANRKGLSATIGFHMNSTQSCDIQTTGKVNIGVRCAWNPSQEELQSKQCRYSLTTSLIPQTVYDGYDATLPMAPAGINGLDDLAPEYMEDEGFVGQPDPGAHYFNIVLGGFDVLNVSVERVGNNLTFPTVDGSLGTHGHGLAGVLVRRRGVDGCPTRSDFDQGTNITALTTTADAVAFCSTPPEAGHYRFGVLADASFGPFPDVLDAISEGMVGPELVPLDRNDPRAPFKEQPGFGRYRLRVSHQAFYDGVLSDGEERPSCSSYGQWRAYYIDTTGPSDAVLEIAISGPVSAMYIRANQLPALAAGDDSPALFDVRSPPNARLVTASPCDLTLPTRWHIALYMAPAAAAAADGVSPNQFAMGVRLRDAALEHTLEDPGSGPAPPPQVVPYADGGRGFACCGAVRNFRVADVPETAALSARIYVTSGRIVSMYLKWVGAPDATCPTAADVDTRTGKCNDFCEMAWLTTRGVYSGRDYSVSEAEATVPHGHESHPDKRRGGAWYIGVQAMPGEPAEFQLDVSLSTPYYRSADANATCNRFTHACGLDSSRFNVWNQAGPPAPPPTRIALQQAAEAMRGKETYASIRAKIALLAWNRALPATLLFVILVLGWWFCRTWRYRRRAWLHRHGFSFIETAGH